MVLSLAYGCGEPTNYKVLSFFFDGVPEPKTEIAGEQAGKAGAGRTKEGTVKEFTVHGPYAARLCDGCHARGGSNKLLLPVNELCSKCHNIQLNKKWVHGPLVSGGCMACHNPHSSPYRFLLNSESREFCFYCHSRGDVSKNPVHQGTDAGCTTCHDAHMSDKKYLLK